jgi:hypothetical protein
LDKLLESIRPHVEVEFAADEVHKAFAEYARYVRPLWGAVVRFPQCDQRPPQVKSAYVHSRSHEVMLRGLVCVKLLLLTGFSGDATETASTCEGVAKLLRTEFGAARNYIHKGLESEVGPVGIDDPVLHWRGFEMHTSSRDAQLAFTNTLKFSKVAPLLTDAKFELCDALADLGTPCLDFIQPEDADQLIAEDPFLAAIFHSHWQWECAPEEIEACVSRLADADKGSGVERVATEALVRMDLLDKIPADRLATWFKAEVAEADQPTRTESLRIVSLAPRGQKYLLDLVEGETYSEAVRADILDMLVYRAEATLRTRRFDFLSEADCKKILAMRKGFE